MECIVLAGGLGTRLRGVIGEQPKCMAPINGKPFLHYLFTYLQQQNCDNVILSLGYKHQAVITWLGKTSWAFSISHVIEEEPLGTGGGILLAMQKATEEHVLVLNGDTMLNVDLSKMLHFHKQQNAATTLALKYMQQFDRYGVVKTNEEYTITAFEEKSYREEGFINGGIYVIDQQSLGAKNLPRKFSFEKDYLESFIAENRFKGFETNGYFIDIGIPADYEKAQQDFLTKF